MTVATGRWPFLCFAAAVALVTLAGLPAWATPTDRVTADEPQYLLSALSLAQDGDLDVADEIEGEAHRSFHATDLPPQAVRVGDDDPLLSPHDPGVPLLLAVPVALAGWVGAKGALAVMAGALAAVTAWVAVVRLAVRPWLAFAVVGACAASAPLATYATQVYPELPAALGVMVAIAALSAPPVTRGGKGAALGVVVGVAAALPWLSLKYVPLATTLVAVFCWTRRHRPAESLAAAVAAASGLALALVVHHRIHGGWTSFPASGLAATNGREAAGLGRATDLLGRSRRLTGLLVDDTFGLAAWSPAWLFLPLGVGAAVRSLRWPKGRAALASQLVGPALAVLAVGWLVAAFAAPTMHGWWAPGRQLVAVLPAGILLLARLLEERPRLRPPFFAAAALGVATWCWTTVEAVTRHRTLVVDLGASANPWYQLWRAALPDGRSAAVVDELLLVAWAAALAALLLAGFRWADAGRHPPGAAPPDPITVGRAGARAAGLLGSLRSPRSDPDGGHLRRVRKVCLQQ